MKEIEVIITHSPGSLDFNFVEIKEMLAERMEIYKELFYTHETVAEAKKDVATLRKMRLAVEDKRKEAKKECMKPYDAFEKNIKELVTLIDEPIDLIDTQVKEYAKQQKAEKRQKIEEYFNKANANYESMIAFDEVFKESWLNASVSLKSIEKEIDIKIANVIADIETIKSMDSEAEEKALKIYMQTKKLSDAIKIITDYEKQKSDILRKEEERREVETRRKEENKEREKVEKQNRLEQNRIKEENKRKWEQECQEQGSKETTVESAAENLKVDFIESISDEIQESKAEKIIMRKYLVKASVSNHDEIVKKLEELGVQWQ